MRTNWGLAMILLLACGASRVWALGTEDFGASPLSELNYKEWPGVVPLVNDPSRVYHCWVNGNEQFFYRGDAAACNNALTNLARVAAGPHEVVLRPGPGTTHSFHGREIQFDWMLHLVGGVVRDLPTLDQGAKVWPKSPRVTICVDNKFDLDGLQVPKGVTLVSLDELSQRGREALTSSDKTVRGWGAGELARLDHFSAENLSAIAKLLDDKDPWVCRNAAGAVALFGKKASSLLPALREQLKTGDEQLQSQLERTIKNIEVAEDAVTAEREHRAIQEKIRQFCNSHKVQHLPD
jgi:hypothetical protein